MNSKERMNRKKDITIGIRKILIKNKKDFETQSLDLKAFLRFENFGILKVLDLLYENQIILKDDYNWCKKIAEV